MKNKKRFTALMMGIGMALSLTGCGKELENKVQALSDLPGKTIGVETGSTGDIYASDYESPKDGAEPSTIVRYPKGNDAIRDLKLGKLDCVIFDRQPAEGYVENNDDLKILTASFAEEEYAIAVSKDNPALKEQINTALAELKEEGVIDDIISNYIGSSN
ncbi:MAG: transporter substrate-binding domain-containing protein, partial [Lachnospiraceae bacterium]|nr:transporter substrate-binding domain-containing protein [Lachnospiraceae bacterium]